jgi:hypothetical protein
VLSPPDVSAAPAAEFASDHDTIVARAGAQWNWLASGHAR